MFSKFKKRLISGIAAAVMAVSNILPVAPVYAVGEDSGLSFQSIELHPNKHETEKSVTLDGMMPEGATAEAVDVSGAFSGIAYDITISDGDDEFQPETAHPIKVTVADPSFYEGGSFELWHIKDDGTREQITDFTLRDGEISFYASGFSVYDIVSSAVRDFFVNLAEKGEKEGGYEVSVNFGDANAPNSTGPYFITGETQRISDYVSTSQGDRVGISVSLDRADAGRLYFEKVEGADFTFYIYKKLDNGEKRYLIMDTGNYGNGGTATTDRSAVKFASDSTTRNAFKLTKNSSDNKCKVYTSLNKVNHYWVADAKNLYKTIVGYKSSTETTVWINIHDLTDKPDDSYELNGKSYGLMVKNSDATGNALVSDSSSNFAKLYKIVTRNKNDATDTRTLLVPSGSDITEWTFVSVGGDSYKLRSSDGKYLAVSGSSLTLVDNVASATAFTLTPEKVDGVDTVTLKSGNKYVSFNASSGFALSNTASKLYFVEKATVAEYEQITYTANRISVSDGEIAKDGAELIVYTRIWDENKKQYDFYAIDHDGSLVPCYAYGDKLMWLDDAMNTLLWKFTVYSNDDGSENGYYELQNIYSGKYIAPQMKVGQGSGQVVQDGTIGIQLPGRYFSVEGEGDNKTYSYGEYYSAIMAWDNNHYDYASLRAEYDKEANDGKGAGSIYPDVYAKADTFYFATLDSTIEQTSGLHEVKTLDNTNYGITMRMADFGVQSGFKPDVKGGSVITHEYFDGNTEDKKGLLSTNLDEDGHPTVTYKNIGLDFGDAFNDSILANHIFIESVHDSSGYFEFDSCQNFATFRPDGVTDPVQQTDEHGNPLYVDKDGKLTTVAEGNTRIYDFTVYRELGTMESDGSTRKHGQFLPYNYIMEENYSKVNPENLYDVLSIYGNAETGLLPDSDPRKHEKLYTVGEATGEDPDYYFGMELGAKFVQTPSGLDAWGHDVIFEFTGDDDFWLYVDGELVIDLGGIHSALAGKVNFRTGDVDYTGIPAGNKTLRGTFYNNYIGRKHTAAETKQHLLEKYCTVTSIRKLTLAEFKQLHPNVYQDYIAFGHTEAEADAHFEEECENGHITYDEYYGLLDGTERAALDAEYDAYIEDHTEEDTKQYLLEKYCTVRSIRPITLDEFKRLYPDEYHDYADEHSDEEADAHFTELCAERPITYEEYHDLQDDRSALEAEYNTYLYTQHTAEEAQAYVDGIFELNKEGQYVFRDYTEHSMKVYYMERGAGASNLHMKFNLSAVTPGNVLFAKDVTVIDNDNNEVENSELDVNTLQFPFIIEYQTEDNVGTDDWTALTLTNNTADHKPTVSYQNSTQTVRFATTYTSPNAPNVEYENVFFLTPGRRIEINFPDEAMYYRITECAVNKGIYNVESSSGELETTNVVSTGSIQDLKTKAAQVKEQPTINLDNRINENSVRHLDVTKHLYSDNTKTEELTNDPATFNYRLYLSNGTGDDVELAYLHKYYILDSENYLCVRDPQTKSFVRYLDSNDSPVQGDNVESLSSAQKDKVTFHTSMYGAISDIPAGYTVRVPSLTVGTKFMIEERDYEMPVGYDLIDYECQMGQKDGVSVPSYIADSSYKLVGSSDVYTLSGRTLNSAGTVTSLFDPVMHLSNKKGFGIKVQKQWSDEDFVSAHDTVYAAVYVTGRNDPLEVRSITSSNGTCTFFFDSLGSGKTMDDYKVYEVELTNPEKDPSVPEAMIENGKITTWKIVSWSSIRKLQTIDGQPQADRINVKVTDKSGNTVPDEYRVSYPEATDSEAARLSAQGNARKDLIKNVRKGGIEIRLNVWNITDESDIPLAGGQFKLEREPDNEGDDPVLVGTYTSDSTGNVTILYGFEAGKVYTLTEVNSPKGYIGLDHPLTFKITEKPGNAGVYELLLENWNNPNDSDNDSNTSDGKYWAEFRSPSDIMSARIDIYNKPYELQVLKVDSVTKKGRKDAHFALYRSAKLYNSLVKDFNPMPGYEDLVTGSDGVIPRIDNTLSPTTYYLTETYAPPNYTGLSSDVVINISNLGEISVVGDSGELIRTESEDHSLVKYLISVPNVASSVSTDYWFDIEKNILVDNYIHEDDKEQKFVFKVERLDTELASVLECFYVTLTCEDDVTDTFTVGASHDGKYSYDSDKKQVTVTYDTDKNYTFPASVWRGSRTVVVKEQGIYRVTEENRWSSTDYDLWSGSNLYKGSGSDTKEALGIKDSTTDHIGNSVVFSVSNIGTEHFAIDNTENRPTASFTNTETEYAYLSAQAYAENTITADEGA